jgi:C4-type Zn-finger protein
VAEMSMFTVHRIYIGARNTPLHRFNGTDENRLNKLLNSYLRGWTITKAEGVWDRVAEEVRVVTVVETPQNKSGYKAGLVSLVAALATDLKQFAVMWESNGSASIITADDAKKLAETYENALEGDEEDPLADVDVIIKEKKKEKQ